MTMGQYWLGKSKPKQAFRLTRNTFNKFLQNFENYFLNNNSLSDQRNSTMAKAMGLIFSLFDVASTRELPFGIPQYICILHGLTNALLCVPFIFADSKKCWFSGCTWWLLLCNGLYFSYWLLWLHNCFSNTSWFILVGNGLNTAGNKV